MNEFFTFQTLLGACKIIVAASIVEILLRRIKRTIERWAKEKRDVEALKSTVDPK